MSCFADACWRNVLHILYITRATKKFLRRCRQSARETCQRRTRARVLVTLFFTRGRAERVQSLVLWKEKRGEGWEGGRGKGSRFVLYVTSLLSVSTGSNRAAVAGNCSSLLPGAPRVQSRIHEFLVRSLPYVPSPTSPPPPASPAPPYRRLLRCRRVRARAEYPTRREIGDGRCKDGKEIAHARQ